MQPRDDTSAAVLNLQMTQDGVDETHPGYHASQWLRSEASRVKRDGRWIDFATGTGRNWFPLVAASGFQGSLDGVESQGSNALQLILSFQGSGLSSQVRNIDVIVEDAADIHRKGRVKRIDIHGNKEEVTNWYRDGMTTADVVSCTEYLHEGFSIPALLSDSSNVPRMVVDGMEHYRNSIEAMATVLSPDGMLLFQDLHGVGYGSFVNVTYADSRDGRVAQEAVHWIADPSYDVGDEFKEAIAREKDEAFWTAERRELLKLKVIGENSIDPSADYLPLNLLVEAAYRVVNFGDGEIVHRDHEIHTGLTGKKIIADFEDSGLKLRGEPYEIGGDIAHRFLATRGMVVAESVSPIYTAAVFEKL